MDTSKKDVNALLKAACLRNRHRKQNNLNRDDHFTLEDIDLILKDRKTQIENEGFEPKQVAIINNSNQPVIEKQAKRVFKAASLSDILGFNPNARNLKEPQEKDRSHDVPEKWKPYYDKLIQLQAQLRKSLSLQHKENPLSSLIPPQSVSEQDEDFSSPDFSMDLLKNGNETLKEVDAAIERIFDGTYGICEITGKPILAKRLEFLPYTRYSLEGQEQMEDVKRSRRLAAQAANNQLYFSDDEDGGAGETYYEDDTEGDL